jgi:hypothetical protein
MKSINGESYAIRVDGDNTTFFFEAALRLSGMDDYAPILKLLKETLVHPGRAGCGRPQGTGFPQETPA